MDISPLALVRAFVSQLPALVLTVLLAIVGQSPNRAHQDLMTELIVLLARPILQTPAPLLASQRALNRDYGVWGRMWVCKWTVPVPVGAEGVRTPREKADAGTEEQQGMSIREALDFAIRELRPDNRDVASLPQSMPPVFPVETEWTAYRRDVSYVARRPALSEREMYAAMMEDIGTSGPTILYFHGGAHCLMDPVTHRWTTSTLARESRGRVLCVRYRLSPQHIFPAALLDALCVYLALIAPPPGAYHTAVPASQIILAGDSSGAGLAASLLLLLQSLSRHRRSIVHHDHHSKLRIPDPVCAGLALVSPWLDITRCLPSTTANARWDIIAPPPSPGTNPTPAFPPDGVWPARPPRVETYCTADMCIHPLVSPLAAQPHLWRGAPPVYVCVGWEGMQDEAEVFARRVFSADPARQVVVFDGYEGMPHCFAMVPTNWAGRIAMERWAGFCHDAASGRHPPSWTEVGTWTDSKSRTGKEVKLRELGMTSIGCWYPREKLDDQLVDQKLTEGRRWRLVLDQEMVGLWQKDRKA